MDPDVQTGTYDVLINSGEGKVEETVQAELNLPEYLPDIQRIVRSAAVPQIDSCRAVGDRVTVDGSCLLQLLYVADDGQMYGYSQTVSFVRHCENEAFADAADLSATADVLTVTCRATGTKRAELKAGVLVTVAARSVRGESYVLPDPDNGIEERCQSLSALSLGCCGTRRFAMSDTVTLPSPAAFVVSCTASAVCRDVSKISNKVMIKGEACIDLAYVPADDRSSVCRFRHTLPVSQILEFDGMRETFTGCVYLRVTGADASLRGDGAYEAADLALGVEATAVMYEQRELTVVTDAYCLRSSLTVQRRPLPFLRLLETVNDTCLYRETVPAGTEGVSEVLDVTARAGVAATEAAGGKLTVRGPLQLSLLVKDAKGSPVPVEKTVDYCWEGKTAATCDKTASDVRACVRSVQAAAVGSGEIEVRAEIALTGMVLEARTVDTVTSVVRGDTPLPVGKNAITVYFPDGEESLWDVACRYHTTVRAVAEENGLEGETTAGKAVLFIPAV